MRSKRGVFDPNRTTSERAKHSTVFRGLILALLSGVAYSFVSVIVKLMKNLHPGQLALYRLISIFVMSMPETVKSGQDPLGPRKLRILMVTRGIFSGLNLFLNFIAFRYLELGEASVIIFSSPVFVTIFARVFLKEPCNLIQSITLVLTIIGLIFTSKLPARLGKAPVVYSSEKIYGLLAAIGSLFSITTMVLLTRKVRCVHTAILNLNFSWVGILEVAILTAVFGNFQLLQCGIQIVYILLLSFFSYTGITLYVMALQCEYAGPMVTMRAASDIGLAFLWQILFFHDVPDIYSVVGAVLALVSVVLISLGKWLTSSQDNLLSC